MSTRLSSLSDCPCFLVSLYPGKHLLSVLSTFDPTCWCSYEIRLIFLADCSKNMHDNVSNLITDMLRFEKQLGVLS